MRDCPSFSFAMDILNGVSYLHSRHLIHGRLTSSNCLVDQRLTIKITGTIGRPGQPAASAPPLIDYGLDDLRHLAGNTSSYIQSIQAYRKVYYAPELFSIHELKLTPPVDIYAFGIILNEIATRSEPFGVRCSAFAGFGKPVLLPRTTTSSPSCSLATGRRLP